MSVSCFDKCKLYYFGLLGIALVMILFGVLFFSCFSLLSLSAMPVVAVRKVTQQKVRI